MNTDNKLTSEEKFQQRINAWLSIENNTFLSEDVYHTYQQRIQRILDVINLREPDRVPALLFFSGQIIATNGGITSADVFYDDEKYTKAIYKFVEDYQPEYKAVLPGELGKIYDLLGYNIYKWPGGSLPDDLPFQYVEGEYMASEDYDQLITDPSGYMLRKYLPRIFDNLQGLAMTPNFFHPVEITGVAPMLKSLTNPDVRDAYARLFKAADMLSAIMESAARTDMKIITHWGVPSIINGISFAPFDIIADTMRGTRGAMMDIYKHPDKLLAAVEAVTPFAIDVSIEAARPGAAPIVIIPLHKGADSFISIDQFSKFYWPSLKAQILGIIEAGIIPILFAEGSYNNERLDLIAESGLPKGKTIWLFDKTDMKAAKEKIGSWACIAGNVPASIVATGTPQEVENHCRELIGTAGQGGGYILAPGAPVDHAAPENLHAFFQSTNKYGVY